MNGRAAGMLGLCARARKIECGADACIRAIRQGRAYVVLLDAEAGPNTRKSVEDACRYRGVEWMTIEAGELGRAVGRPGRMAAALTDEGMARRFADLMSEGSARQGRE